MKVNPDFNEVKGIAEKLAAKYNKSLVVIQETGGYSIVGMQYASKRSPKLSIAHIIAK